MNIFTIVLAALVAAEFFFIMYLETVATTSAKTAEVFGMDVEDLQNKNVQNLFKNQGIYNGLLGLGILYSVFVTGSMPMLTMILVYIICVALYGSVTVDKAIILKQGGLAILALVSLMF